MRYLLAFFFFFMYMGDDLGLNIGLAPGVSTKNLLLYLIFVGLAVNAAVARDRYFELPSVIVPFVLLIVYAFMTWIVVGFIFDDQMYLRRAAFIRLKSDWFDQLVVFLIFFYGVIYLKDTWWLLRAIICIVIVGHVITVIDTFNIPNLGILDVPRKAGRFSGFIGMPNTYGQVLALFIPASIALYRSESGKTRTLLGIGLFTSVLAFVLTGSRGSYVGLIAGAIVATFFLRQYIPRLMVLRAGAIALAMAAIVITITFVTGYADVWVERTLRSDGSAHVLTSGRTTIWMTALKPLMDEPISLITGFGYHAYASDMFRKAAHNLYLLTLYELGLIGLMLFLIIVARILMTARLAIGHCAGEYRPQLIALIYGFLGFLIANNFSIYNVGGYLLWAYLGTGMRLAMHMIPRAERNVAYTGMVVGRSRDSGQPVRDTGRPAVTR